MADFLGDTHLHRQIFLTLFSPTTSLKPNIAIMKNGPHAFGKHRFGLSVGEEVHVVSGGYEGTFGVIRSFTDKRVYVYLLDRKKRVRLEPQRLHRSGGDIKSDGGDPFGDLTEDERLLVVFTEHPEIHKHIAQIGETLSLYGVDPKASALSRAFGSLLARSVTASRMREAAQS